MRCESRLQLEIHRTALCISPRPSLAALQTIPAQGQQVEITLPLLGSNILRRRDHPAFAVSDGHPHAVLAPSSLCLHPCLASLDTLSAVGLLARKQLRALNHTAGSLGCPSSQHVILVPAHHAERPPTPHVFSSHLFARLLTAPRPQTALGSLYQAFDYTFLRYLARVTAGIGDLAGSAVSTRISLAVILSEYVGRAPSSHSVRRDETLYTCHRCWLCSRSRRRTCLRGKRSLSPVYNMIFLIRTGSYPSKTSSLAFLTGRDR